MPFPIIILAAAVAGFIGGRKAPDKFKAGGAHEAQAKGYGAAIIDDHTPLPAHAVFSRIRIAKVIAASVQSRWL
ncbi:hypothetical protein [Pantoea vagans]|uniref:hypothetical protein n=1 Tax=Pantoea vagans TaxID=470934 RepID=UPI003D17962D